MPKGRANDGPLEPHAETAHEPVPLRPGREIGPRRAVAARIEETAAGCALPIDVPATEAALVLLDDHPDVDVVAVGLGLERLEVQRVQDDPHVQIAVRLKQLAPVFSRAGIDPDVLLSADRRLVRTTPDGSVRFLLLKPDDVPDYFAKIGRNTGYIIHPEEVLAENFVLLVRGKSDVPTPRKSEESTKDELSNRK